jgi:hypothetical protein
VSDWRLGPGTYWLDWQTDGLLSNGPYVPPVTIVGQTHPIGANAIGYEDGVWRPIEDPGSHTPDDFKFVLRGEVVDPTADVENPLPASTPIRLSIRPNPVPRGARISYSLAQQTDVNLSLYDASGRLVRILVDHVQEAGAHMVIWDGQDECRRRLPVGSYFLQLRMGGRTQSNGRLVYIR